MGRRVVALICASAACALLLLGCARRPAEPALEPTVSPPAIKTAGELAVGIDLSVPPFGGRDEDQNAGFDVDVAAALAERLGLKLRVVDVPLSEAATALAQGTVDVMMSVRVSDAPSAVSLAGIYATDGPGFFISTGSTASVEPSLTLDDLAVFPIGVQESSESHWLLLSELDASDITTYPTLRAALDALRSGRIPVVAGDAFVGAYIIRDMPGLHFAGTAGPVTPLAAATAAENETLAEAVRAALDELAADGVLDALRRKWVGALPDLGASPSRTTTPSPGPE